MNNKLKLISVFVFVMMSCLADAQVKELKTWLKIPRAERPDISRQNFSHESLSKKEAELAIQLLLADKQSEIANKYDVQWKNRELVYSGHTMPFYYSIFNDKPKDGRSLFISLHGGGSTSSAVNDGQYKNQQHLYDKTMNKLEGVYLAMRAPTDAWNMWHKVDIDDFINIIIQMAVIKEGVNPNKVYLLGYSAGGDGVYQLAPRMADRFAAASMMAGHPGDSKPNNLLNLPFAIHVGGNDGAYSRNKLAGEWKLMLDSLELANPGHYQHQAEIHAGYSHWMKLQDAVALPWMAQFTRNPIPKKIIWRQDNRYHEQFYWLRNHNFQPRAGQQIIAEYDKKENTIIIIETYTNSLQVLLNDKMLNLNKTITFNYKSKPIYTSKIERTILNIYDSLKDRVDPGFIFSAKVELKIN